MLHLRIANLVTYSKRKATLRPRQETYQVQPMHTRKSSQSIPAICWHTTILGWHFTTKETYQAQLLLAAYKRAISIDPSDMLVNYNLGLALYDQGDLSGAVAESKRAIAIDPKHASALRNLGLALSSQGDSAGAVAAYKRVIPIDPKHATTRRNLGLALYDQGNLSGAVATYKRAISIDPSDMLAYYNLSTAHYKQGNLSGAVAAYKRTLSIDPKNEPALRNLGSLLSNQGNHPGAAAAYKGAIGIDPKNGPAHSNLGMALYARGNSVGAIAACKRSISIDLADAIAHCSLGLALYPLRPRPLIRCSCCMPGGAGDWYSPQLRENCTASYPSCTVITQLKQSYKQVPSMQYSQITGDLGQRTPSQMPLLVSTENTGGFVYSSQIGGMRDGRYGHSSYCDLRCKQIKGALMHL